MKSLSIEQFNKAQKYEHQFNTAVYSRYLRAQPTSYYADLVELCNELKIRLNLSCPACVLNAVTLLGKMYFETKEELDRESEHQKPQNSDLSDKSEQSEKPKTKKPVIAKKPIVTRRKTNKK